MLKLIVFACCIALIILLTSKKPALVKSRFHGYWNGRCNYEETDIMWNVLINDEGQVKGTAFVKEDQQFDLVGKAEANGYYLMAGMYGDQKFQFEGAISEFSANGSFTLNGVEKGEWFSSKN